MFKFKSSTVIIVNAAAFLCFAALLAVASVYDLQISRALSNGDSFFAQFFAVLGEYPAYLVLPVAGVIIFYNHDLFDDMRVRVAICVLGAALSIGGWIFFGVQSTKLTEIPHLEGFACMFGIMLGMLGLWLGSLIEREKMHRLFKFAVFAVAFAAAAVVVMQVMKNIWCRMRYRDMLKAGSEDGFTPWYKIMFGREDMIEDGDYTSFPSGHTFSAAVIYSLLCLPSLFDKLNKPWIKAFFYVGTIGYTALVAISRIVVGAHFMSDVLMGGTIAFVAAMLGKEMFVDGFKHFKCFKKSKSGGDKSDGAEADAAEDKAE